MRHVVNECPLTCFDGGISELHQAQDAAFNWPLRRNLRSWKQTTSSTTKPSSRIRFLPVQAPDPSIKKKVWFYIALYPVRWTAQSALHFPPLADLFIPTPFSASLGSILAMQQLRNDYSLTFPPLSIARYSFIQLSRLRRREVKENAQTSKR